MVTRRLRDLARIIRSKNAGPFLLTFDVLFPDLETYQLVWDSGAVTRATVAKALSLPVDQVVSLFAIPRGFAIKATVRRPRAQNAFGESDTYGCQQHAPLLDLPVTVSQ
ncbi:MAG: DUF4387 domain-containing protein [Alphaproteobacteria bacterium]|nr:DUF4387 domain-containing protein [Alphaproteobacteria bacterium]